MDGIHLNWQRHKFKSVGKVKYSEMNSRKLSRKLLQMTYMYSDQIHFAKSLSKDMDTNNHVQQWCHAHMLNLHKKKVTWNL